MSSTKKFEPTGFLAYVIAARDIASGNQQSKHLLLYYAVNVDRSGGFFKSVLDIALETGLSDRFIRKKNREWKKLGILDWEQGDWHGKANQYALHLQKLQQISRSGKEQQQSKRNNVRKKNAQRIAKWRQKDSVTEPETVTKGISVTERQTVTKDSVTERGTFVTEPETVTVTEPEQCHEPKHEPITYMNQSALLNPGRKTLSHERKRGAAVTESETVTETPAQRTVADVLKELPKERADKLYRRTQGKYKLADAEAELATYRSASVRGERCSKTFHILWRAVDLL